MIPPSESTAEESTSPVVRSALWAAWADALGFQTELAGNQEQVQRRLGAERCEMTQPWRRRIGGRFGIYADLPPGTYSDDTQLRLAVSRCLRSNGRFDIEAFSKIELAVFPSYELGGGVGTKVAAQNLMRKGARWNSNFYANKRSRYVDGGGNGAAMRIQPHVWASPKFHPNEFLPNVIRDTLTTHGHPRGLLGAALHALTLGAVLRDGAVPPPERWQTMVDSLRRLPSMMLADEELAERWAPLWKAETGNSFDAAVHMVIAELHGQMDTAVTLASVRRSKTSELYADLADRLGGLSASTRGSGTVAAVLSLWLAWRYPEDAAGAAREAANLIGSDTDTVATMAGALLGPMSSASLPSRLVDARLIAKEADRLDQRRRGLDVVDFPHPDPLHWVPPETFGDSLGLVEGQPVLAGLGPVELIGRPLIAHGNDGGGWQWCATSYDQHVLVKRRDQLRELGSWALPRERAAVGVGGVSSVRQTDSIVGFQSRPERLEDVHRDLPIRERAFRADMGVEEAVQLVLETELDPLLFTSCFRHFVAGPDGIARATYFAALVAERTR